MTAPILTTKLYIPPPRPNLVPRPHLIRQLEGGPHLGHRLTLVSAPAGFGKTTLVGEWVCHSAREVAWFSLDEGDNDPTQFLNYLIAALQQIDGSIGQTVQQILHSPQAPPPQSLVTPIINDVIATSTPLTLVLDDCHLVTATPVHQALQFLVEHQPPSMHLVISTREDPPLSLPRLRARGQVTEIRERDLRFTEEETAAFLNQTMGLGLAPEAVRALEARTEGWIAGLQLAALSMQGRADVSGFIAAFTGSNRYVLDYLVEEVLRRQPEDVQSFLLQTAILDRMTGPLCKALTGRADSQTLLETLEQANLFIIPLDQDRTWYRYHRLFAEFLRGHLQQPASLSLPSAALVERIKEEMPDLHRRASEWYERDGLMAEAVAHALSAHDLARAARLIEGAARETLMRGETSTLLGWLEALSDDLIRSRPALSLARAWALVITGQPDAAEAYVEAALQAAPADDGGIRGEAATVRTLVAMLSGDVPRTIQLARQALEHLAPADLFLRGMVALNLGLAYDIRGDVQAASRAFAEARAIGQAADNPLVSLMSIAQLADIQVLQGKLDEASDTYQQALEIATEPGKRLPIAAIAYAGLGQVLYEWNDLDAAARCLTTGLQVSQQWEINDMQVVCSIHLARVRQAQGDAEATGELMRQADQVMQRPMVAQSTVSTTRAFQARLWVRQGRLEAATHWAEAYQAQPSGAHAHERQIEGATYARFLLAQSKPASVAGQLAPLLQVAQDKGQNGNAIELLALGALALAAQKKLDEALETLSRALALAKPGGYVRTFVDEGEPMAKLLRQAQTRGVEPEYVDRLLKVFAHATQAHEPPSVVRRPSSLVEPLSPREREVLQLLATGLSNREIAQKLVIAVGTVKQHLKSIYGKLEVHNRTEAANRARELGLL